MKITRARLRNYIGLHEGTGLDEIELDFRPCLDEDTKVFFFFGRNGSGKSTLVAALTPFAENFDGRATQIIPGEPGLKEIELQAPDGTYYLAEHRWSTKGKVTSFLYQDKEPLFDLTEEDREDKVLPETAKGNITTFRSEIQRCLGITKEYLKIGRIGGRISSLIEMGATERKKFISGFMPILEDWQRMYKHSSHRLSMLNSELRGITTELDALPEEAHLEERGKILQGEVDHHVQRMLALVEEHGALVSRLEGFKEHRATILGRHGIDTTEEITIFDLLTPKLEEAQRAEAEAESTVANVLARNTSLKKYETAESIAERHQEIIGIEARVEAQLISAKEKVDDLETRSAEANATLSRVEERWERVKTGRRRYREIEEQKKTAQDDLAAAETDLIRTGLARTFDSVPKDELDYPHIKAAGDRLHDLVGDITQVSAEIATQEAVDLAIDTGLDEVMLTAKVDRETRRITTLQEDMEKIKARLLSSEKEASLYRRFEGKHCVNPTCPYQREVKTLEVSNEDVGKKRQEIADIKEQIEWSTRHAEIARSLRSVGQRMRQVFDRARPYSQVYLRAGLPDVWRDFKGFIQVALSPELRQASIQPLCDYAYHVSVVNDKKEKLEAIERTLEDLSSLSGTEDDLATEAAMAQEAAAREREALDTARKTRNDLDGSLEKCRTGLTLFKTLIDAHKEQEEARAVTKGIGEDSRHLRQMETEYRLVLKSIDDSNALQDTTRSAEDRARKSLEGVNLDMSRRKDYERRVDDVQGRMTHLKAVVDGCHPSKGAPVHFVKSFLDRMRSDVNGMLDTAFSGELRLDFVLTESEFSMPVMRSSGRIIKDISEASEGQQALAKTVINLVTVQRTIAGQSGYNVVSLDEIDGPLDRERNRERFVSIVEEFIETMGLEQIFVISHNDAFHATQAGMILLPGHALPISDNEMMKDKRIVFEAA